MRFSAFIAANLDSILKEWDAYAHTLLPGAKTMSEEDLRDHAREILLEIAKDMESRQKEDQRSAKSKRLTELPTEADSLPEHPTARRGRRRGSSSCSL
jgi:hypothetical protein